MGLTVEAADAGVVKRGRRWGGASVRGEWGGGMLWGSGSGDGEIRMTTKGVMIAMCS